MSDRTPSAPLVVHIYLSGALAGIVASASYFGLQHWDFRGRTTLKTHRSNEKWMNVESWSHSWTLLRAMALPVMLGICSVPSRRSSTQNANGIGLFVASMLVMVGRKPHIDDREVIKKTSVLENNYDSEEKNKRHPSEEVNNKTIDPLVYQVASATASQDTNLILPSPSTQVEYSNPSEKEKYLEMFVHNVSHTDLVLGLDVPSESEKADNDESSPWMHHYIRPRFSNFDQFCRLLLQHLRKDETEEEALQIIQFPRHQRSMMDLRYTIQPHKESAAPQSFAPTGFQFRSSTSIPVPAPIQETIRIRGRDASKIWSVWNTDPQRLGIRYVFFPLLATLLPVWHRQIQEKEYHQPVKRVLVLVTGVGTPRNFTHTIHGNSTEKCADLMKEFLRRIDPTLTVVQIHSHTTNIFRSDENIVFCERELMPVINAYRNAHVLGTPYPDDPKYVPLTANDETHIFFPDGVDWRTTVQVTLSLADGSPARTQAIQSSLRSYKPTYFHFWQLKTFWHESKIVDDDIEVHSFATMESVPAVDAHEIRDICIQAIIREMRAFYNEMTTALTYPDNDIDRFWLRKSHKPVLAVLLVQSSENTKSTASVPFRLYRGTNMEVSMPTGSLCAERNAIGSALAMNPNLKRHDLKIIAVLAVPPVEPVLLCMETTAETNQRKVTGNLRHVTSYSSIVEESLDPEDRNRANMYNRRKSSIGSDYEPTAAAPDEPHDMNASVCSSVGAGEADELQRSLHVEPVRRIPLFPKSTARHPTKRTVVVQSTKDMNPLLPCGACNEWLKKITQSNPYFKIITFTDAQCNGIYISSCQE
jgi:cytidine deaminase